MISVHDPYFKPVIDPGSTAKVKFYLYPSARTILDGQVLCFFPHVMRQKRKNIWKELQLKPSSPTNNCSTPWHLVLWKPSYKLPRTSFILRRSIEPRSTCNLTNYKTIDPWATGPNLNCPIHYWFVQLLTQNLHSNSRLMKKENGAKFPPHCPNHSIDIINKCRPILVQGLRRDF